MKNIIIRGRLYGYRGAVVRAGKSMPNGTRHVSFHKQLHGFVKDNELTKVSDKTIKEYLSKK